MDSESGNINISDISGGDTDIGNVIRGQIGGDVVGRDKIGGDRVGGNKVVVGTLIINYPPPSPSETAAPETPSTDAPIPNNPYRGLFAFRPEHAHLFFGRESFTEQLVQAVKNRSFTAVLGASGSGKSSVVFAGLVPALAASGQWLFTTFRPGDDPYLGLASALVPLIEPELNKIKQVGEAREVAQRLREGRSPVTDYIKEIQKSNPDYRLLIIADQFEELFTLCRDSETRHKFLNAWLSLGEQPQASFHHLVMTLRADFLNQASLYRPFADALQGTTELIGPMTREELTQAIEMPAQQQGVQYEDKLVERILDDVGQEAGSLPLLEFALSQLWQHQYQRTLTHVAYEEIGQAKGALSTHADQVYQHLTPAEQAQARRIFVKLVNPGMGTADTRRRVARSELEAHWSIVVKLANERLLTTNRDKDEQETVELVHEALIQEWYQLHEWIEEDRINLRIHHRLTEASNEWKQNERDQGYLYRGLRLAEVEDWTESRVDDLNTLENEFLEHSLRLRDDRHQEQLRNKVRAMAGNGTLGGFLAGILGGAIQNIIFSFIDRDPTILNTIINQAATTASSAALFGFGIALGIGYGWVLSEEKEEYKVIFGGFLGGILPGLIDGVLFGYTPWQGGLFGGLYGASIALAFLFGKRFGGTNRYLVWLIVTCLGGLLTEYYTHGIAVGILGTIGIVIAIVLADDRFQLN